jgi:chemosensory pili system protein ChpA (sensor histidine kinase/response regulator)
VIAPLEHILRNAVAHGLEDPQTRRAARKAESGKIVIAMGREGSELTVSVSDDGAGIDFAAVRKKAEQAGLVAAGADATREELLDCLMAPGFSTADSLTQVSGRGVGMDVVADSVRSLGGSLSIESQDGKGARFIMRMPFSLSLAHTLLVRAGGAVYAVPLAGIEAMARISPEDLKDYVDSGAAQVVYDDETYDLHSLGALLGGSAPRGDSLEQWLPAMLVKSDNVKVALQVDAVIGSQETMVKPVGPLVNSVPGLSGATILPDGRVVLILEMAALVRSLVRRQAKTEAVALQRAQRTVENETLQIMVIDDSITMRKVTSKLLQRNGMKVHLAKDGLDAAGQLEDLVPDAIVLDIEMPRMDGFELAAHIRNRDHLQHLPIIMVTSRTGDKHRQRAARLNVQEYLGKPYREEELLAALRRILGSRAESLASGKN